MTRPKITPGPWYLGKRAGAKRAIYGDKGAEIALPFDFFMEDDEALANARAIAAVPALLELAERMLKRLDSAIQTGNCMAYASAVDGNAGACIEDFQLAKKTLIAAGCQF